MRSRRFLYGFGMRFPLEITLQIIERIAVPTRSVGLKPEIYYLLFIENQAVPTIGIGGGNFCDGQVSCSNRHLGIYDELQQKFCQALRQPRQYNEKFAVTNIK